MAHTGLDAEILEVAVFSLSLMGVNWEDYLKEAFRLLRNGSLPVAPNLIERDFSPALPNRVWTTDITYLDTGEGWLYLTVMLDLFSRQVVGWSIQPRMTQQSFRFHGKSSATRMTGCTDITAQMFLELELLTEKHPVAFFE